LTADEREHRTLRILAPDNPAAAGFDTFNGCIDGIDVDVEIPTELSAPEALRRGGENGC